MDAHASLGLPELGATAETFPPVGFVVQAEAAARLGVSARVLRQWIFDGRLDYAGVKAFRPPKAWCRVYELGALDQAHARMCDRDAADRAARATIPEGFLDRAATAQLLGIAPDTLALWHTNGRLRTDRWWTGADGKRCKIYRKADVEALKTWLASRSTLPEGVVDIDGAVALAGVSRMAFERWIREGRVPPGEAGRSTTNKPCRLWPVDVLREAITAIRGPNCVYMEAGDSARWHIPDGWVQLREASAMLGVNYKTVQRWEAEGLIVGGRSETARRIRVYPRDEIERLVAENGRYAPAYPDPQRPGCYRVPLAGESIARREAIIDAADLPIVAGRRFHFSSAEGGHGRVSTFDTVTRTSESLRRLILGTDEDAVGVGHRNDDPLDCRRSNLVSRTISERNANMRKARSIRGLPPSSRFKGVCFDRSRERWVAYVKKDGVSRSLGRFRDELAAAQAYDDAARELFGEHARLNFPDGVDAWLERETAPERAAA